MDVEMMVVAQRLLLDADVEKTIRMNERRDIVIHQPINRPTKSVMYSKFFPWLKLFLFTSSMSCYVSSQQARAAIHLVLSKDAVE